MTEPDANATPEGNEGQEQKLPSAHPPSGRVAGWLYAAGLCACMALLGYQGLRMAALPTAEAVAWNVVIDDGYYYLQVARNLARGQGFTFDRQNPTTGFQPLWAVMLAPIFLFTDDAGTGLRAALVLALLLGCASLPLLYLGLSRLAGRGAALLYCALLSANPFFLQILQGGLETPILCLCLSGLVALYGCRGARIALGDARTCHAMGLLLGLTVLARVDVALILAPFGLGLVLFGGGTLRARWIRAVRIAWPALVLLLPYILFNLLTQGTPVPVSGLVKRWVAATYTPDWGSWVATEQWRGLPRMLHLLAWPRDTGGAETLQEILPRLKLPAILLGVLLLRLLWSRGARANRTGQVLLGTLLLGVVGHGLYMFFVYRSAGHWNYHYFFPLALMILALLCLGVWLPLADLGNGLRRRTANARLGRGLVLLGALLALVPSGILLHRGFKDGRTRYEQFLRPTEQSFRTCRYDAALHLGQVCGKDMVIGAWWAGTLGYFSNCQVVNLDGVINSSEYFRRYLKPDRVHEYLTSGKVTHLADFFWRDPLDPANAPSWRAFFWEHDKEHIVARLRPRLRLVRHWPYQGGSGLYLMAIQ